MVNLEAYLATLPVLGLHLGTATLVLALGMGLYVLITPYHELRLIREHRLAAAILFAGALLGMALPVGASLQYALTPLDIVFYGVVAVILQIIAYFLIAVIFRLNTRALGSGDAAPAIGVAAGQIAVGLLNAGALSTP